MFFLLILHYDVYNIEHNFPIIRTLRVPQHLMDIRFADAQGRILLPWVRAKTEAGRSEFHELVVEWRSMGV